VLIENEFGLILSAQPNFLSPEQAATLNSERRLSRGASWDTTHLHRERRLPLRSPPSELKPSITVHTDRAGNNPHRPPLRIGDYSTIGR